MLLLTVGDVHISDKPFGSRIDDYQETTINKLIEIREDARKNEASGVLFTGDIFHFKSWYKNSYALVNRLIRLFQSYPCPVYVIPGNHDMVYDKPESIPNQPLGAVLASGAMIELRPEGLVLEEGSLRVRIAGTDYNEKDPLPNCMAVKKQEGDHALITVGHFYSGPGATDSFFGHTRLGYEELKECDTDIWVLGHFHNDQGIQELKKGELRRAFINIGSLTRGSLDEDNINRIPSFGRIRIQEDGTWSTEQVPIPNVLPASEIFSLEKYEERKQEREAIREFVTHLKEQVGLESFTAEDKDQFLATLELDEEIKLLVEKYIEEAEYNV